MLLFNLLAPLYTLLCLFNTASAWTNPINTKGGSDPFVVYSGGYYYLMTTTWTDVEMARASTIAGLKTATRKVVYSTTTASRCCNVWAPEVHYFDGAWYIYYTAGESADLDGQNVHVLKGGYKVD
jgi:GH43 family beta-xylosidase